MIRCQVNGRDQVSQLGHSINGRDNYQAYEELE